MNETRIAQLEAFLKTEPDDPFIIYALATEYAGSEPQKAWEYYERLLNRHPGYIATYYHAAALKADMGDRGQAENLYQKGIALCREQQELKTLRELQAAYQNFMMEEDED